VAGARKAKADATKDGKDTAAVEAEDPPALEQTIENVPPLSVRAPVAATVAASAQATVGANEGDDTPSESDAEDEDEEDKEKARIEAMLAAEDARLERRLKGWLGIATAEPNWRSVPLADRVAPVDDCLAAVRLRARNFLYDRKRSSTVPVPARARH